jgi:uncharacterized BrkB/YihY/UPF0761 family membrane protein
MRAICLHPILLEVVILTIFITIIIIIIIICGEFNDALTITDIRSRLFKLQ